MENNSARSLLTSAFTSEVTGDSRRGAPDQITTQARGFAQRAVLSASGWRGVCAADGDPASLALVSAEALAFFQLAGRCFAEFLLQSASSATRGSGSNSDPDEANTRLWIALASDTRPTSAALREAVAAGLADWGVEVRDAGDIGTPALLSWSRQDGARGFVMVTASHNPPGWNGLKFGLGDGRVLSPDASGELLAVLRSALEPGSIASGRRADRAQSAPSGRDRDSESAVEHRERALSAYARDIRAIGDAKAVSGVPVLAELNGSARIHADTRILPELTARCAFLNTLPGVFAHGIVPEGKNLDDARAALSGFHPDAGLRLAYVPDCDGDRGNLVVALGNAAPRALGAQETFALAVAFGLDRAMAAGQIPERLAVVGNGATSLRIDQLCAQRGVRMVRCETGEANVVAAADRLEAEGLIVPVRGEGSNGGSIISPLSVRDPLALISLLLAEDAGNGETVARKLAAMPAWQTSSAYDEEALLRLPRLPGGLADSVVERCTRTTWASAKLDLKPASLRWSCLSGVREIPGYASDPGNPGAGLRIVAHNEVGAPLAALWMRPSRTEPVFRLMAEVLPLEGETEAGAEARMRALLSWFREQVLSAVHELDPKAAAPQGIR